MSAFVKSIVTENIEWMSSISGVIFFLNDTQFQSLHEIYINLTKESSSCCLFCSKCINHHIVCQSFAIRKCINILHLPSKGHCFSSILKSISKDSIPINRIYGELWTVHNTIIYANWITCSHSNNTDKWLDIFMRLWIVSNFDFTYYNICKHFKMITCLRHIHWTHFEIYVIKKCAQLICIEKI